MTPRAKELADEMRDKIKRECKSVGALVISESAAVEIVAHLDVKAAIDSAVPGEVGEIAERLAGVRALPWTSQAEQYLCDIATLLAIVQRQAQTIASHERELAAIYSYLKAELGEHDGCAPAAVEAALNERDAARAEVERLKERCARDDTGVTIHACPPKGEGMMPCCDRPPFEVMGDRMTTNSALVNCDRVRLQTERAALAQENARLTERLRMMQHGEAEALKMMAAEKQRADVLAEGVRHWRLSTRHGCATVATQEWELQHGHMVSK